MATTIITTVGTSLIENNKIATTGLTDKTFSQQDVENQYYKNTNNRLYKLIDSSIKCDITLSAELTSITQIQEQLQKPVIVHLVCTDTILSPLCAEYIKKWLLKPEHQTKWKIEDVKFERKYGNHIVEGLRLKSKSSSKEVNDFKEIGIKNLINALNTVKDESVINITGGYKGVIPIMTIWGQLNNLDLYYTYEGSSELVKIGKMPFGVDWSYVERFASALIEPEKIQIGKITKDMYELGLIEDNKTAPVKLTVIGTILANHLQKESPFQKTTMGYLAEYKVYEYYSKNNLPDYPNVEISHKFEENSWLDADIWMSCEKKSKIISAEIKHIDVDKAKLRKQTIEIIDKILHHEQEKLLEEYWVIMYLFEGENFQVDNNWWQTYFYDKILKAKVPKTVFKLKTFTIAQNAIDKDNRIIYQNFMRSEIENITDKLIIYPK